MAVKAVIFAMNDRYIISASNDTLIKVFET